MKEGEQTGESPVAEESAAYLQQRLKQLPDEHKRIEFPHQYKVGISEGLEALRDKTFKNIKERREL
jgi:hypothetical protein